MKVEPALVGRVQEALKAAGVNADFVALEGTSVRARFANTDTQIKAKDAIAKALNPDAERPVVHRGAEPGVALAAVAGQRCARCRCTWGWTCAAACTS